MKITAEYESRKPASKMTEGFISISTNAEANTEFIPLTFLFIRFPACKKVNISVALITEGVSPVTKANDQSNITVRIILNKLNLPFRKNKSLKIKRLRITA